MFSYQSKQSSETCYSKRNHKNKMKLMKRSDVIMMDLGLRERQGGRKWKLRGRPQAGEKCLIKHSGLVMYSWISPFH